jgi:hypothetical protein
MGIDDFRGARISACCKGCEERYQACHDYCDKYQNALNEWKEYKDKIYQAKELSEYDKYKLKAVDRYRKRKKWHDKQH